MQKSMLLLACVFMGLIGQACDSSPRQVPTYYPAPVREVEVPVVPVVPVVAPIYVASPPIMPAPIPVIVPSVRSVQTQKISTVQETRVSPIVEIQKGTPSSNGGQRIAPTVTSTPPKTDSFSSRAGLTTGFSVRDTAAPKPKATAFGVPAASITPPKSTTPSFWGGSSASAPKPSYVAPSTPAKKSVFGSSSASAKSSPKPASSVFGKSSASSGSKK